MKREDMTEQVTKLFFDPSYGTENLSESLLLRQHNCPVPNAASAKQHYERR